MNASDETSRATVNPIPGDRARADDRAPADRRSQPAARSRLLTSQAVPAVPTGLPTT